MKSSEIKAKAEANKEVYKALLIRLKGAQAEVIDQLTAELDKDAFERIDCRSCANCCKTAGPLLVQEDINRLSEYLKMDAGTFIKDYLQMDEDGDFIFVGKPCPFLQADDLCGIYEIRPKACREYPHTNRKNFSDLDEIHLANSAICPAVQDVLDNMLELESAGKIGTK